MAAVGTVKTGNTTAAGPSKPRGRPRKELPPVDYTHAPNTFNRAEEFSAWLAGYPDKRGLLAYIYRVKPIVDNSLVGRAENTCLKTADIAEMSEDFVGATFGRGVYMLRLTDANRPKAAGQNVAKTWFTVTDPDLSPIYDPRTLLLADPKNADEVARLLQAGILVRDSSGNVRLKLEGETAAAVPSAEGGGWMPKDAMGQMFASVLARGVSAPDMEIKRSLEFAKLLMESTPKVAAPSLDEIAAAVAARLQPAAAPAGDFSTFERVQGFLDRVRPPVAAAAAVAEGASDGVAWATNLPAILAGVGNLWPMIVGGLAQLRAGPVASVPVAAVPVQGRAAAPPTAVVVTLEDRIAEVLRLGFMRLTQGTSGFDFAAWLCCFHPGGLEVYRLLEPAGVTGVMGFLANSPAYLPIVNDPQKRAVIEKFLEEFFDYDPDGSDHEGLESPAPVAASNGVPLPV
jgi:hypothetical protein